MSYQQFWITQRALQERAKQAALSHNHPEGETLNVAVVGAGIGELHVDAFTALDQRYKVICICDLNLSKAQALADRYGVPQVSADYDEIFSLEVDVVDLCTPPHGHCEQIRQALAAGVHVICEKPLVASLADVDALIDLERASPGSVMPIFQYRYGHGVQQFKHLLHSGLAGKPYLATVETHWNRDADYYAAPWRGKWRSELGGVLVSQAIHSHDLFYHVMGPAKRVFARLDTKVNDIEMEDCVSASLQLESSALATLSATLGAQQEISRHRFCFEQLTAESGTGAYTNASEPWTFTTQHGNDAIQEALETFQPLPEGYVGQFLDFHRAISHKQAPAITLKDARASLELITALYHSSRNAEDVRLPLDASHPLYHSWIPAEYA